MADKNNNTEEELSNTPNRHSRARRKMLVSLTAAGAATGASSNWVSPIINEVILPAHARMTCHEFDHGFDVPHDGDLVPIDGDASSAQQLLVDDAYLDRRPCRPPRPFDVDTFDRPIDVGDIRLDLDV